MLVYIVVRENPFEIKEVYEDGNKALKSAEGFMQHAKENNRDTKYIVVQKEVLNNNNF